MKQTKTALNLSSINSNKKYTLEYHQCINIFKHTNKKYITSAKFLTLEMTVLNTEFKSSSVILNITTHHMSWSVGVEIVKLDYFSR
jgi:hypothetical protein